MPRSSAAACNTFLVDTHKTGWPKCHPTMNAFTQSLAHFLASLTKKISKQGFSAGPATLNGPPADATWHRWS